MDKKRAEHVLDSGVKLLCEFLPLQSYLYFPVLYSVCVWAVRRVFDLKERILAWQIWLEPGMVESKPDDFILNFFESNPGIREAFAEEVQSGDKDALRKAFAGLYPVCGLEDAFLMALFRDELEEGAYRKISEEFGKRAVQAIEDIKPADSGSEFWNGIHKVGMQIASLGIHVMSDAQVRKIILDRIRKKTPQEED
ncbi:MAG: hypothetical protein ACYDH0_06670 [Candidatus Aminicenantales bacterium]